MIHILPFQMGMNGKPAIFADTVPENPSNWTSYLKDFCFVWPSLYGYALPKVRPL